MIHVKILQQSKYKTPDKKRGAKWRLDFVKTVNVTLL